MSEGNERVRKPADLLNEELLMQIPSDPQKEEIIEILAKSPSVISYIQNILSEIKGNISMKKMLIKKEERELDRQQSQIRMDAQMSYKRRLQEALEGESKRMDELMEAGFKAAEIKERLKLERPEKPTATDLRDVAVLRTQHFYNANIAPLEEQIQELEKDYELWKVRYNLFENNFKSSQSIKGLIQQELNNYNGSH